VSFDVARTGRRLVFAAWLVVVWVLLWGGFTLANVVGGLVVAGLLLVLVPRPALTEVDDERDDQLQLRPLAVASLAGWFAWKLVAANVTVAIEALRPQDRSRIRTAIVAVELPGCPPGIVTLVANIITLTPGTLTMEIDADEPVLYVHELTFTTREAVRSDVYEVERRVVRAFGSANARRAAAGRVVAIPAEPEGSAS
jgi:multicomponent Na+:H+ antiporter subunit E